jgi:putative transposase
MYGHGGNRRGVLQYAPTLHNMPPQTPSFRSPSNTVGAIIRGFKSAATKRINILRDTPGFPLWQRNYFDRIIGSDWMYENIVNYIDANPRNWAMDDEYTS